jgi:hypothetical protein
MMVKHPRILFGRAALKEPGEDDKLMSDSAINVVLFIAP